MLPCPATPTLPLPSPPLQLSEQSGLPHPHPHGHTATAPPPPGPPLQQSEQSVELPLADVLRVAGQLGFRLLSQELVDAAYMGECVCGRGGEGAWHTWVSVCVGGWGGAAYMCVCVGGGGGGARHTWVGVGGGAARMGEGRPVWVRGGEGARTYGLLG